MAGLLRNDWCLNPAVPPDGPILDRLLAGRGVVSPEERARFLHPGLSQLHDPFLLPDMAAACRLIGDTLAARRPIMIHGDYDADGLTATALLVRFFRRLGCSCACVIPDRISDGYGIGGASVEKIIASGAALLITVDCGIANHDEIARLAAAGIPTIVTDHHECPPRLPQAAALINPKRPDSAYPFTGLAGVGVALKLAQALSRQLHLEGEPDFDLAALGTVADVVPLCDENRAIVSFGLQMLQARRHAGLAALLVAVGQEGRAVTSQILSFSLAPRLNAAGRLGEAGTALDLLLAENPAAASQAAARLGELNQRRQELESAITAEAITEIDSHFDFSGNDLIIVSRDGWHQGVIGIVAARLAELYRRPVIALAGENGLYRGSGRSSGDFDLFAAIGHAADYVIQYGGHRKAAGVTVQAGQLEMFRSKINEYARRQSAAFLARNVIEADLELDPADASLALAGELQTLEPFGEGNPQPLFLSRRMTVQAIRQTGSGRHLKLKLAGPSGSPAFEAIAFGQSEADGLFTAGDDVDVLYSLEINSWQGRQSLQLNVRDLTPSRSEHEFADSPWIADQAYRQSAGLRELSGRYGLPLQAFLPDRREFKEVYQFIRSRFGEKPVVADLSVLSRLIASSYGSDLNMFRLARILAVFQETGLVRLEPVDPDRMRLALLPAGAKVRLEESAAFCRLEAEGAQP